MSRHPIARKSSILVLVTAALLVSPLRAIAQDPWSNYAGNAQHSALSIIPAQSLDRIIWQTPVDLDPEYTGGKYLLAHYGSPLVTAGNTIIMPVTTGEYGGFQIEARSGFDGTLKWTQTTDYALPPHNWIPSYSPGITPQGRLYYAGAGGTVYFRGDLNGNATATPTQVAFYGNANYTAHKSELDANIMVSTPITSDAQGNIYFGYRVTGGNALGLQNGLARIAADGTATYIAASSAVSGVSQVVMNCAPALSNDGKTVYVTMSSGNFGSGYLVALNSSTLATTGSVLLRDPRNGNGALLPDDGTGSPMVGPDGDVYIGALENPFGTSKGWMLHFNSDLNQSKTVGAFGWDDTPSVVPSSMVPSYTGHSSYLLMTKYNNYASTGGDGVNKIAILDPNDTMIDPRTGATVMKEILTIAGPTPDADFPGFPNAVREWCINTAVVDPFSNSVFANSEDGVLYRWDLTTNTFSERIRLTDGIGEAYTPTFIGADGKIYAINDAKLFAVGSASAVPEPSALLFDLAGFGSLAFVSLKRKRKTA